MKGGTLTDIMQFCRPDPISLMEKVTFFRINHHDTRLSSSGYSFDDIARVLASIVFQRPARSIAIHVLE